MYDFKSIVGAFVFAVAIAGAAVPSTAAPARHGPAGGPRSLGLCSVGATQVSIAGYDGLSSMPAHSTVSWTYTCRSLTGGVASSPQLFTVVDSSPSAGYVRYMSDGKGNRLAYFLCVDPQCSQPIGAQIGELNAAVRSHATSSIGSSVSGSLLLYVLVPPQQRVPVGDYADTLNIDIQY